MPVAPADGPALSDLAARLTDMAAAVAREAEAAAAAIRALTDQAHEVAALATALDDTAAELEREVGEHKARLISAHDALNDQRPAVEALAHSPARLSVISRTVQQIARQSQMLSINARIEAARSGPAALGFAAVATEMSELARRTKDATGDIGASAYGIANDVEAARALVLSQDGLVAGQADLLGAALGHVERQRATASLMAMVAGDSAERVNAAATSIGRVGATAIAVKMLAREISKRA